MADYNSGRISINEVQIVELKRRLRNLEDQLAAVQLMLSQVTGPYSGGGGGGSSAGDVYFCEAPSSGSWGASGTWPSVTPGSFTADVYKTIGGTVTLESSGATVYNTLPASPENSKVLVLGKNPDGTFSTVAQSCT